MNTNKLRLYLGLITLLFISALSFAATDNKQLLVTKIATYKNIQNYRRFTGAVYVMSNRSDTNTIVAYGRRRNGKLVKIGEYKSGGAGTGPLHPPTLAVSDANDPLISADSIIISSNRRFLLAVNSLSGSISSFRIYRNFGLKLIDTIASGGNFPNSIAETNGYVYVANIGDVFDDPFATPIDAVNANISGFYLNQRTGKLSKSNVSELLSSNISRPSNVQLTADAKVLVTSEINTGNFVSWTVENDGALSNRQVFFGNTIAPAINGSGNIVNANPLGFKIVPGLNQYFIVATEAREAPTFATGSVSVYSLNGETGVISNIAQGIEVADQETTCWIAFNDDYSYFYTANSRTNSISSFAFDTSNGDVEVIQAEEFIRTDSNGNPASAPIDITASNDGKYIYQLFGRVGVVTAFVINSDGTLTKIQEIDGDIPDVGTQGIVAW